MSRRLKTLVAAGILLGVAILIPIVRHYQLRAATEAYIAKLKDQGEPMDLAQVIPPPVPPEKNAAPLFLRAAALFSTNDDVLTTNPPSAVHGVAPGKAMVGWMQSEIREGCVTNSWEEISNALDQNEEALKLLNQMTNHSTFDFQLQYAKRFEMQITNLVSEKRAAQRLSASALCDFILTTQHPRQTIFG